MIHIPIDIHCPSCSKLASFEEPFEFLSADQASKDKSAHRWGGWAVIERFPSQITWKPPAGSDQFLRGGGEASNGGYPLLTNGLVQCTHCHINKKHRLNWPMDAYWQWEVRGELLWAWDRRHAHSILEYIRKTTRPTRSSPGLKYIPSNFLTAKVRDIVVRKIEAKINA